MEDVILDIWLLAAIFLVVATAYSSVGLGGASAYTALLTLAGASHVAIPTVSLVLNVVVSTVGAIIFAGAAHLRLSLILPFLSTSIPMSFVGGALDVSPSLFRWLLLLSLAFVAARIYLFRDPRLDVDLGPRSRIAISLLAGAVLGLLAGIVGIGGGIYLVPLIIVLRLGTEKEAAASGAVFILVNSAAALVARFVHHPVDVTRILPLVGAVLVGGVVGSHLGSHRFSPTTMQRILGLVVLAAIVFLARKILAAA